MQAPLLHSPTALHCFAMLSKAAPWALAALLCAAAVAVAQGPAPAAETAIPRAGFAQARPRGLLLHEVAGRFVVVPVLP